MDLEQFNGIEKQSFYNRDVVYPPQLKGNLPGADQLNREISLLPINGEIVDL